MATATLLRTVRVSDTPEATTTPRTDSLPLVAAAASKAIATPMTKVIPTATSTRFTR